MTAARTTLPNTGHRTGLYVVTGPSWIGGSGGWGRIAGFIGASFAEVLWRLAYAGAVRTMQIANAPGGEIFARRGAMDTASRDFNHDRLSSMWELLGIAAVALMIFGVVVMVWNHFDLPPPAH